MFHLTVRAIPGTLVFLTWSEARVLWDALVTRLAHLRNLALMPDHVHALVDAPTPAWGRALSAYARWRNASRGTRGAVWQASAVPEALPNADHARRTVRYVHLNPCRAGLVADPLAWPFSTHRDCVGLTLLPARNRMADPPAFHTYVSSDPTVRVQGTLLPARTTDAPDERLLEAAVSELLRMPLGSIREDRSAIRLLVQLGRDWAGWSASRVAGLAGIHPGSVRRIPRVPTDVERLAASITGDRRFPGLVDGDLRSLPGWERYRWRR
jgi:REP element-mobilizing transposase RayT